MTAPHPRDFAGRLASGKASLIAAWIGMPDPLIAHHLGQEDFDAVVFDMQHGMGDVTSTAVGISTAIATGKAGIARIPVGAFSAASRLLDAGASGIIAPMINSVADAKAFAAHTKYPPVGERSWGPALALGHFGMTGGAYLAEANARTAAIAMIETREALAALDDILAVPGIDGVFVGPSDLSIALSQGRQVAPSAPEVTAALATVLQRARAHGKSASVFCVDGATAATLLRDGYDMVIVGNDVIQIRAGAAQAIAAARKGISDAPSPSADAPTEGPVRGY